VEGRGAVVAAEQVPSLPAAVAGIVVGGPAAPPHVPHQRFATTPVHLLGLRGRQQRLDLLEEEKKKKKTMDAF